MKILVTGGAGYLGSQLCSILSEKNFKVIIYDNMSAGSFVRNKNITLIKGDILNKEKLVIVIKKYQPAIIIHLAGKAHVKESYLKKKSYYFNNLVGTTNVLKAMAVTHVKKIIFSSSCLVYGTSTSGVKEKLTTIKPISPYAKFKLMAENKIKKFSEKHNISYVILRFFNLAGTDLKRKVGFGGKSEDRLIPNSIKAAIGLKKFFYINGKNFNTFDGTCIRDFVHPADVSLAIVKIIKIISSKKLGKIYNIGTNKGYSVLDILRRTTKITNKDINFKILPRRKGDPSQLVANSDKIISDLKWKPKFSNINYIIKTSYEWIKKNNKL
jgi:UDP-glucose 4-epimerase